jgi:hypothetical protein
LRACHARPLKALALGIGGGMLGLAITKGLHALGLTLQHPPFFDHDLLRNPSRQFHSHHRLLARFFVVCSRLTNGFAFLPRYEEDGGFEPSLTFLPHFEPRYDGGPTKNGRPDTRFPSAFAVRFRGRRLLSDVPSAFFGADHHRGHTFKPVALFTVPVLPGRLVWLPSASRSGSQGTALPGVFIPP